MKMKHLTPLLVLLLCQALPAQVKIGENPQTINPTSLLELESTEQVLVITRVTNAEMGAITPSPGALVYNTEEACLFYYSDRWINLCEALGLDFTSNAIAPRERDSTIIITRFEESVNFEVGQIIGGDDRDTQNNILDFSIVGRDIRGNSIGEAQLAPNSVGNSEMQDNAITGAEIDLNLVTVSTFTNDAGYLVTADLISEDPGNDLLEGSESGVFYDNPDGVIGNEVTGPTDGTLVLFGAGTNEDRFTLDVATGGISTDELADLGIQSIDIADEAITAEKINANVAGTGLAQDGAGALQVDVTQFTGDGALNSPNGTITLTGITESALFEDVALEVNIPQLISGDQGNSITAGADNGLFSTDDQNAEEVSFDDSTAQLGSAQVQGAIEALAASNAADSDTDPTNEFSLTGAGPPGDPGIEAGQTYVDTAAGQLYAWNGTDWIPVGGTNAVDNDPDPFNEINTDFVLNGTLIELSDNGGTLPLDLDPTFATDAELAAISVDDADADPTNEQNTSFILNGTSIELTDSGGTLPLDLDPTFATNDELAAISVDDADADPTNEQNTSFILNGTSIELTDSGGTLPLDLDPTFVTNDELAAISVDDADADPTNEQNTSLILNGTSIELTDSGGTLPLDLDPIFATDAEISALGAGLNLSNSDLTQIADRDYNLDGFDLIFSGPGSIGIGTSNPQNKLHVVGEVRSSGYSNSNGTEAEPSYSFSNDTRTGMWRGPNTNFLRFSTDGTEAVTIDPSQNVGIGYSSPSQRLDVNGSIRANNDFISGVTTLSVPDYVFKTYFNAPDATEGYSFKTLQEVELFIKKNHHLPGIPSEKKVKQKNMWNVTRASLNNLEKIEELFLYTIEQEDKIEALQNENAELSKELQTLKERMARMESLLIHNKKE